MSLKPTFPSSEKNYSNKRVHRFPKKKNHSAPKEHVGSLRPAPRRNRFVKKFDPSLFIKKVEETVATPVYEVKNHFDTLSLAPQLLENIRRRGYTQPTHIQDLAIPVILEGKDIIGSANTGTGKTASFLIPLVHRILTKQTKQVLIVTPTRELAAQIQDELMHFKNRTDITSTLCIGKTNIWQQIARLKRKPQFVIGTPGRLKDLTLQKHLQLAAFDTIVLDEVDTMLDMGFINDIKFLLDQLPEQRHSLFFSATISDSARKIMDQFLKNPVTINVKTRQSAENVNQQVVRVKQTEKVDTLHDLLIKPEFTKVIVFAATQRMTDTLAHSLRDRGFKIVAMHGNKTQSQRNKALALFKTSKINILLTTDVVARGIDIDNVSHVINFDQPQTYEDYIHRIGRTGRGNNIGQALTFVVE